MNVNPTDSSKRPRSPQATVTPGSSSRADEEAYGQRSSGGIGGVSAASSALRSLPRRAKNSPIASRVDARDIFSVEEKTQLKNANKVALFDYSSTGGGHTARGFEPLVQATEKNHLNKGDVVVIMAPPKWQHDHGNASATLNKYIDKLKQSGLNVIVKQSDKTVVGLYKPSGESNNAEMVVDFVDKARRPVGEGATAMSILQSRPVPAFQAKNIVSQVVTATGGNTEKIMVVGDMAPYTQKAAVNAGIADGNRVEVGNHQSMFGTSAALDSIRAGKDMAYVSKASGNTYVSKLALVDYNPEMNTVMRLPETFNAPSISIKPNTSKTEARKIVFDHLLAHAQQNDLNPDVDVTPGIIVSPHLDTSKDTGAIYLYVNDYTKEIAKHIKQKINEGDENYKNNIYVICGAKAWKPVDDASASADVAARKLNILHLMYAANADGVTSAGFGTTSEYNYLKHNDYRGGFLAIPVENQHEQQANAVMLKESHEPGVISVGRNIEELKQEMDVLSQKSVKTSELTGDMSRIIAAAEKEVDSGGESATHAGHAAELIRNKEQMKPDAKILLDAIKVENELDQSKQVRRLTKLHVSALQAIQRGETSFTVAPTAKVDPKHIGSLGDTVAILRNKDSTADLLDVELEGPKQEAFRAEYAEKLQAIINLPPTDRPDAAKKELERLGDRFFLGW